MGWAVGNIENKNQMTIEQLLKMVENYGDEHHGTKLSLIIEHDGSGCLIKNVFLIKTESPVFTFSNLKELISKIS